MEDVEPGWSSESFSDSNTEFEGLYREVTVGNGGIAVSGGGSFGRRFKDVDLEGVGFRTRTSSLSGEGGKMDGADGSEGRLIAGGGPSAGNLGTGSEALRSKRRHSADV